jgi:hypothetical protein
MDQQEQASIERAPDDGGVRGILEVHSPGPDAPARTRVVGR